MPLPQIQTAATASGRIDYRAAGRGTACVLLHGIGGNSATWCEQFEPLGARFRIIAWDAPGYGDTQELASQEPTTEHYADALRDLLDAVAVTDCILVGHSLGALVAACFAANHPTRVRRLILADAASGHAMLPESERLRKLESRLAPLETMDVAQYAAARVGNLLSANASEVTRAHALSLLCKIKRGGYRQASMMLSRADIFPYLASLHAPSRVICGRDDRVTPPQLNRKIADAVGGDLVLIAGGHLACLENPADFNEAVLRFAAESSHAK